MCFHSFSLSSSQFSHLSPHLLVLVSMTLFQSVWLAGGLQGHLLHWLRSLAAHLFLSHHLLCGQGDSQYRGVLYSHWDTWTHTEEYKQHSVWELQWRLFTSCTDVPLGTSAGCDGAAQGAKRGLWGCRGPNRAPESGWGLPLWDTKHCLCWERPWGWEHRPEIECSSACVCVYLRQKHRESAQETQSTVSTWETPN